MMRAHLWRFAGKSASRNTVGCGVELELVESDAGLEIRTRNGSGYCESTVATVPVVVLEQLLATRRQGEPSDTSSETGPKEIK